MNLKSFGDHSDQLRNYELEIQEFLYLTRDTHYAREMGVVNNIVMWLFEAKTPNGILITSGWQGDEPAGWSASKLLCSKLKTCSFIPIVSPSCFISRNHRNNSGVNIDRGWPNALSSEGAIMKGMTKDIVTLGKKAFISLQEDPKRFVSYFYAWNEPNQITELIQQKITKHFPLSEDGKYTPPEGLFCEYAVSAGCDMAIQLETPADGSFTLAKRIDCQVDIVKSLVEKITSLP